jgi:hypothetical protein
MIYDIRVKSVPLMHSNCNQPLQLRKPLHNSNRRDETFLTCCPRLNQVRSSLVSQAILPQQCHQKPQRIQAKQFIIKSHWDHLGEASPKRWFENSMSRCLWEKNAAFKSRHSAIDFDVVCIAWWYLYWYLEKVANFSKLLQQFEQLMLMYSTERRGNCPIPLFQMFYYLSYEGSETVCVQRLISTSWLWRTFSLRKSPW